jgi:TonB family protein
MTPDAFSPWVAGANHLWQSTICLGLAACLVRLLRPHEARWRFLIWLTASLKFLVPFSWLVAIGASLPYRAAEVPLPQVSVLVEIVGQPFSNLHTAPLSAPAPAQAASVTWNATTASLLILWLAGLVAVLARRCWNAWQVLSTVRQATGSGGREIDALDRARRQQSVRNRVRLRLSETPREPGVIGVLQPAVVWPVGLTQRLSDSELHAILAHEVNHVRRQDNLTAAIHSLVESIFWFYPPVWWLGSRLLEERERACDQAVAQLGIEPRTYAESILKVCHFCLQAPTAGFVAATSSNLTRRLEEIMSNHAKPSLGTARRLLLVVAAAALSAGPIALGAMQVRSDAVAQPLVSTAPVTTTNDTISTRSPGADVSVSTGVRSEAMPSASTARLAATSRPVQNTTGTISGTITDQTGMPIGGATIAIQISTANVVVGEPQLKTFPDGTFAVANLPAAEYDLRVQMTGFRAATVRVPVAPGATALANIQLAVGGVTESITTTPGPPRSQTLDETQLRDQIARNPRNASNYLSLANLYFQQGRSADAEALLSTGLDLYRDELASRQSSAPVSSVRVGGNIDPPKKIRDVRPVYPPDAAAARAGGIVIMEAKIATDGTVRDPRILRSAPMFDQAALDAVRQWIFTPTLLNGSPVEVIMTVTVNFPAQ